MARELSSDQAQALQRFRAILQEIGAADWLALRVQPGSSDSRPRAAMNRITVACLFRLGGEVPAASVAKLLPPDVVATLEALGLIVRTGEGYTSGVYRLIHHLGLFLFCHQLTPQGKFYYGPDSLALSRVLEPAGKRVLDLCAGVGAQALECARTAAAVTAVEIVPEAEPIFWVNAAMNGLIGNVEFLSGNLFGPVEGRQFELISANPPFLPVAPGIGLPLWSGMGADGLEVVHKVLAGLPQFLTRDGLCQIVAAVLGTRDGPHFQSVEQVAAAAGLRIDVSCFAYEALDEAMLSSFAATAMGSSPGVDVREAYRAHFGNLGATHLFYYVMKASFL